MFIYLLSNRTQLNENDKKALQVELANLKKKLDNVEERFVNGEIDQVLYIKFRDKYRGSIQQIELELENSTNQLSNLEKSIDNLIKITLDLPSLWRKANFRRKQRIQNLVFPEGIHYNRKNDDY